MSSSTSQGTCLRPFIFSILFALGFILLLYTYYSSDMKLPSFSIIFHSMNLQFKTNPNCSQLLQANHTTTSPETTDTILLIWMWPFGYKFDSNCEVFGTKNCLLTDNRSLYHQAHGVLFHHRDIYKNLDDLPKDPRPCFQKWVWTNMESPDNSPMIPLVNDLFNLTCNYRLDSNIPVPYGYLVPVTSEDEVFKLPPKDKLVCWIVSNWNNRFQRVRYYEKLKNHIKIYTYGQAFGSQLSQQAYVTIILSCKFYLSFENSIQQDYVTEKLFSPMTLGSVPIVLGPPRDNYEEQIPKNAFIHVNDFATPEELANRLHYLDKHPDEYMDYFKWRSKYKVKMSWFGKEHACKTCTYIQKHKFYQVFRNITDWYWG